MRTHGHARLKLAAFAVTAAVLGCAAPAGAASLTPGDVAVYRVGSGSEGLSSAAAAAFVDEFEPDGSLVTSLPFPTSASGSNKALVAGGGAESEGEMTLSENGKCLVASGYSAAVGSEHPGEQSDKTVPRVVAVVEGNGTINTTTALTNAFNENNIRSAASTDCKHIWVGGAGGKTTGGVLTTEVGKSTATQLNENDTNLRGVNIVDGQLYVSADPTKAGAVTIATVGSGVPTATKQTIANLPFEAPAPEEPYGYSMLTLGLGSTPDTLYVADSKLFGGVGGVAKYGLTGGKWVQDGAVEVPYAKDVAANDVNGVVTIYATSSGSAGKTGTLYKISDVSGVNGRISGIPVEIAKAPANEAFRGVAFAPGTTIGSGGTPPPAPTISAASNALPAAIGDPTNETLPVTIGDSGYAAGELKLTVESSNEAVAPVSGITLSGTGSQRTLSVAPAAVGLSKLTLTVEAPNGAFSSTQVNYGASEYLGNPSQRYYSGEGTTGSAVEVGEGYVLMASDEGNTIDLYRSRTSSAPLKSWNFSESLPYGQTSVNIHSSARAGNTIYWAGSMENNNSGEFEPASDTVFATTITGSGASTELQYAGGYTHLRESLITWDEENGERLGFKKSTEAGQPAERAEGFKLEGLEFAPGSTSEAFLTFRAPLESPETRELALVIPVTNFSSLITPGENNATNKPEFGAPMEWKLDGLGIRQIRRNSEGEYLIVASTATSTDNIFQIYGWDGEAEDEPVLVATLPAELDEGGVWDAMPAIPNPITDGSEVEVLQDNDNTVWYGAGTKTAKKGLTAGLRKDIGELFPLEIPAPGVSGAPRLSGGASPNRGEFTLHWKPASTLRARFTLEHQNARQKENGEWSTVATGLTRREYTFTPSHPESEGTWTYRVREQNESGEAGPSQPSEAIKVDRTPPNTPTATASRPPDYVGASGSWYKDSATVSFTDNGDPTLADGSPGSGVDPATLTPPETFTTSGTHLASGTVADHAGNVSAPATLEVKVDATPPSLEIECPETALVGEAGVTAEVSAADAYSGLATDPSGVVPISTAEAGPVTVTRTAVSNVGLETTSSCTTQVRYPTPGAPALTVGRSPNDDGLFTLGWTGANPLMYVGLGYTLQHHDAASSAWSTVAGGIEALSYEFSGAGEEEGTWVYRVAGVDLGRSQTTEYSAASAPVVVDRTPPFAPTAKASRPPDYAGGGGWYRDKATVGFTANGDPALSDGSPGSGVDASTLSAPQTFETSGSHTACGTVADNAGNVSSPGCATVQVDATPPSLEITCPETALVGESGVTATVRASDSLSGLAVDPSGTVNVGTTHAGPVTITRTAVDNVEHETTRSCTTLVEYPTPGAPALSGGRSPNRNGLFTLEWGGADPTQYYGLTYTLQGHDASTGTWSTIATGIQGLSYQFSGAGEAEGTWVYRVEGVDPSHHLSTAFSATSAAVVVDRTPPNPPTAKASRAPDYAGGGGWYRDSVTVGFTANGDPALSDGSPGSGVDASTLSAPQTFETSGSHTACGTVADNAGNVSGQGCATVQVDATPPSLEITCPETAVVGSAATATVKASDALSGLASDPSGEIPIDTTIAGPVTTTRTAVSNVGLGTTRSCTTQVYYPTPGAPTVTKGSNPNSSGLFTVGWTGADPIFSLGLGYTLQEHDAASPVWTTVATGIEALSYEFSGAGEAEGTWVYRVEGVDPLHGLNTAFSAASAPVVIDKTPPNPPTAKASRAPDYAGGGGWYRDSVTVGFTANGDPALSDGSPGSGVDASTLSAPQTFETSGSHTACGTVADNAGNVSGPGCTTVQVDATPPSLELSCPSTALVGEAGVTATVTASDGQSGLAVNPSGTVPVETVRAGPVTITRTAVDNVGHETTRSCSVQILESPPELGRCVAAPSEKVGRKTVYHGWFSTSACKTKSSTQTRKYEWVSGVQKPHFTTALAPSGRVLFEATDGARVFCQGESGAGTFTTAKTVGGAVIRFTGCSTEIEEHEQACTTPGRSTGDLETSELEGQLGVERLKGKAVSVGLDLYPVGKTGAFVQYTCGKQAPVTLSGSVIASAPAGSTFTTGTFTHTESAGLQKPEGFVGGAKDVLTNNHGEQVGLSDAATMTVEEPMEINGLY